MKKLFFLVSFLAFIGVSSAWAQTSTAIKPFINSTHTYQVSADQGTYDWKLTTSQDGAGDDLIGSIATGTDGSNSISLTWVNPAIGTTYYLHVLVTGTNNCVNRKAIAIQPANNFQLDIKNINAENTNELNNTNEICSPDVTNTTWAGAPTVDGIDDARNFTYNYGTSYLYYKIIASGINFTTTQWTANFDVDETVATSGTVSVHYVFGDIESSTPDWTSPTAGATFTAGGKSINSVVVPTTKKVVFVRVTVANSTTNETLAKEDLITTLLSTSKENATNLNPTSLNTTTTTQTIKPRPNAGAITTP